MYDSIHKCISFPLHSHSLFKKIVYLLEMKHAQQNIRDDTNGVPQLDPHLLVVQRDEEYNTFLAVAKDTYIDYKNQVRIMFAQLEVGGR